MSGRIIETQGPITANINVKILEEERATWL
jgi:hypothetical protein